MAATCSSIRDWRSSTGTSFVPVAAFPKGRWLVYLDVWRREVTHLQDPELIEPAVNVDTTTRYQTAWQVRLLPLRSAGSIDCRTPLADVPDWLDRHAPSTARLSTTTIVATAPESECLVAPAGGYRSLENHLYRVEVHRAAGTTAGLKWSRENANVASTVLTVEQAGTSTTLQVDSLGRDEVLSFKNDDWVEILTDRDEFDGAAGAMRQVTVNPDTNQLTVPALDPDVFPGGPVEVERHMRVIRWDQAGSGLTADGLVEVTTDHPSFVLEYGIQATLGGLGGARVGDHWCFAARVADADIEHLEQAPPRGVHHHFCALAIVEPDGTIHDCRPRFPALTELTSLFYVGGDGQEAAAGLPVPQPLQVAVASGQRPVAGARVRFVTGFGGGTLQGTGATSVEVLTGPDGVASCSWKLGPTGGQQVVAQLLDAAGTPMHVPIRFNATIGVGAVEAGVHVRGVTLVSGAALDNDHSVPVNRFADGLVIACDAPIERDTVRNRPTCVVALELPYPLTDSDPKLPAPPIVGYQQIRLAADTDTNGAVITWSPTKEAQAWLADSLFALLGKQAAGDKVLAHLVLLGNFIWATGKPEVWLDGDFFGVREKAGETIPTSGRWPTGDGRRGGNLHMWFWLTPPELVHLDIDPRTVSLLPGGQQDFTVSVTGTENRAVKFDPIGPDGGTIQPTAKGGVWTYTAPKSVLAANTVAITAESVADPTQRGTADVTLLPKLKNIPTDPDDLPRPGLSGPAAVDAPPPPRLPRPPTKKSVPRAKAPRRRKGG